MEEDTEVYCPRDIMACIAALQENPDAKPDQFLCCSGEKEFLQEIVDGMTAPEVSRAEALLAGGFIRCVISWTQFFTLRDSDAIRVWYLLYLTGFLTMATEEQMAQMEQEWRCFSGGYRSSDHSAPLVIPTKQVRALFMAAFARRFREDVARSDRTGIFSLFWGSEADGLQDLLHKWLVHTVTFYGDDHGYYHDFLTVLFSGAGCDVSVSGGQGQDKQQILILDTANDRCAVIGVLYSSRIQNLSKAAEEALCIARDRAGAEQLKDRYQKVALWGMAFLGRNCKIIAE